MPEPSALVLAAGKGTRMRSALPKPLVPVSGRAIVLRLLDALAEAGVTDRVLVVGHGAVRVIEAVGDRARFVTQAEQRGMAHAVSCAREALGDCEEIYVFVGDTALLRAESVQVLRDGHRASGAAVSFLTATFPVRLPYARVIRGESGEVAAVIEERDAPSGALAVREYMSSHYLFRADGLWPYLDRVEPHPVTGELYLTDVLGMVLAEGRRVSAVSIPDWRELVGPNTPEVVTWAEGVLAGEDLPFPELM